MYSFNARHVAVAALCDCLLGSLAAKDAPGTLASGVGAQAAATRLPDASVGMAATAPAATIAAAPAATISISMKEFMFAPPSLTVKAGSTVTWTNLDQEPHTVVSTSGLFRSGALDTRESFSYRFAVPGTYPYFCTIHPRMVGTVVVE
jgi:plastocyanin